MNPKLPVLRFNSRVPIQSSSVRLDGENESRNPSLRMGGQAIPGVAYRYQQQVIHLSVRHELKKMNGRVFRR